MNYTKEFVSMAQEKTTYDLSMRTTPDEWLAAQEQSPQQATPHKSKPITFQTGNSTRSDYFSIGFAVILATGVTGVAWYLNEREQIVPSLWMTLGAGAAIAIIIRVACSKVNVRSRRLVAVASYVLAAFGVLAGLTQGAVGEVYGSGAEIDQYEHNLISRLDEPRQALAYVGGAVIAWALSHILSS